VLLDHLARPKLADGPPYAAAQSLFDLAAYPGVYLKLTNRTFTAASEAASTPGAFAERVVSLFGADRIVWGSNFPAAEGSLASLLDEARTALRDVSDADRMAIFAGTVSNLYPALGEAVHG
jgi:L-fuconolactonase